MKIFGKIVAHILIALGFITISLLFPLGAYLTKISPEWLLINNGVCIGMPLVIAGFVSAISLAVTLLYINGGMD